ncbi:MAG: hypothetical protein WC828_06130 [Thermoleophilia bacterium]|jgi:hypothetical protein
MAVNDMADKAVEFEKGIAKWQVVEDDTIASCEKIIHGTDNELVKTIAGIILADSARHKHVLGVIMDTMNGTVTLTPEDLGQISELLDTHLDIEKQAIEMAMTQYENSHNFVVRHLLTYLLEDEKKHYKMLSQLNDFKKHLYPYA